MKKKIALLLAAVLAAGSLATACGDSNSGSANVKVGLGLHTTMTSSKSAAADAEGLAQADLTVAAVTLNEDGTIADVKVDAVQVKTNFDATGKITSETNQIFKTKKELGLDYNMKSTSAQIGAISGGAEWYEQVAAFETVCKGLTADEVAALAAEDGSVADDTLKTGCTIKINALTAAVVKACDNAQNNKQTAASSDTLRLGLEASISSPTDASADSNGSSTADATFTAVTTNTDGKITACVLDAVQAKVTWDATGTTTSDLTTNTTTKYDLKENYGMKDVSASKGIISGGGEWYEQADVFMQFVQDKTLDDVKTIAVDGDGYTTDEVLKTGCTINILSYLGTIEKALAK